MSGPAPWAGLCLRFYLGLGAPAVRQRRAGAVVRAAAGVSPELVAALVARHRGEESGGDGQVERINFRCSRVRLEGSAYFVKEFPRARLLHDLERILRCSRADRAWRAGHLLPHLGVPTPRPVGTAHVRHPGQSPVEYLATEWLSDARPFPRLLRGQRGEARAELLGEFVGELRRWRARGIYLRDLVKNVLVTEGERGRTYWLTDLDGLHPLRRPTFRRLLHHLSQLAHWAGPLSPEETELICKRALGEAAGPRRRAATAALRGQTRFASPEAW